MSDILTCFDEEKAEQFLDKKGYFTNRIGDFHRLKNCKYGELVAIVDDPYYPYASKPDGYNITSYSFFVPECKLKPDTPLTLEALKKEISELRDELHDIKYQLNKPTGKRELKYKPKNPSCDCIHPYGFNPQSNCCTAIDYPNGFNPQSNWCK